MYNIDINSLYAVIIKSEYIKKTGWLSSILQEKVIDAEGDPIPWFTYPAIDLLNERVKSSFTVFEYGCGFGTLWWANRVKRITIVEHNIDWYRKMSAVFPKNVRGIFRELEYGGDYSKTIEDLLPIKFDVIVIDGRDRINCCKHAIKCLSDSGIIILDNSNRKEYVVGRQFLKENGFRELQLFGLTPMITDENSTSFFYKEKNCLDL